MSKEIRDEVSFGLDLVHLAVRLGSSQPSRTGDVPAEVEQLRVALRQIAVRKRAGEQE